MSRILDELEIALKVAYEKEEIARKELHEAIDNKGAIESTNEFGSLNEATGFTNGLLEAMELVRLYQEDK